MSDSAFNRDRPLQAIENINQTLGCRHSSPEICSNNRTPKKCAFAREDNLCLIPPASWRKLYEKLLKEQ